MKLPPFTYYDPRTVAEALELLAEHGTDAKILAGGQSLLPLLTSRHAMLPGVLVDINRVRALDVCQHDDHGDHIGAICRQHRLETDAPLMRRQPLLAAALALTGYTAIRTRGTLCGNLAHADPASELAAVALTVGARLVLASARGQREMAAQDFFVGPYRTALAADELVTQVTFPTWPDQTGGAIEEVTLNHGGFALIGVVAQVSAAEDGYCGAARLTLFGAGGAPQRLVQTETLLMGEPLTPALVNVAADVVRREARVTDRGQVPAAYRRRAAGVLVQRALRRAAKQAGLANGEVSHG